MGGSRIAHIRSKQSLLSFEISCIGGILRYFKCFFVNTGRIPYRKRADMQKYFIHLDLEFGSIFLTYKRLISPPEWRGYKS